MRIKRALKLTEVQLEIRTIQWFSIGVRSTHRAPVPVEQGAVFLAWNYNPVSVEQAVRSCISGFQVL